MGSSSVRSLSALELRRSGCRVRPALMSRWRHCLAASAITGAEAVLTRHIERLEAMLTDAQTRVADLEADRDAARGEARDAARMREALDAQLATLNAVLAAEWQHAEDLRADRDRWHRAA